MSRVALPAALAALALPAPAAAAEAAPEVHAHRGGAVVDGVARYPENTLPAFRAAAARRFVLELDVKLTLDRVPVVVHDDTLDRTTTCRGRVADRPLSALRRCRADLLGSGSTTRRRATRTTIPTLAAVLALARRTRSAVNLEIKNLPTDADWDPTEAYAERVMQVVAAARLPRGRLVVQSFLPQNLRVARRVLPGVTLSFLGLRGREANALDTAVAEGAAWVSPSWPVDAAFVRAARARGVRVVPYTLNRAREVRAARAARVDALITDDPVLARRVLRRGGSRPR